MSGGPGCDTARATTPLVYRPDVDGLRAIAAGSIVLAHAGVPLLRGGFLGVDIFFVISGFLITSILERELGEGRFSLARFYERRARRILPSLLLVVTCCIPPALYLMLPEYRQNFGQSVVATLFFSNNLLLALTSGYWELESSFKPLLHTWSLGVEEQFYLAFPLLLAVLWRFGRRARLGAILLLAAGSFALSDHGWRAYPAVSFYLPTSRAWELMAGCAAAYVVREPRRFDPWIAAAGLALVIVPMVVFSEITPSLWAAAPVAGTVGLILFSRPGGAVYHLLSLRPMVFVGLISYSLYLWHQPLFAFARIASPQPPGGWTMAGMTLAALALSTATWRFIEVPFRRPSAVPLRTFVPAALTINGVLIALGLTLHLAQGFPRWTYPNLEPGATAHIAYNERIRRYATTAFPGNDRPGILVMGDSFARDAANILIESGALEGKNLVYAENVPACSEDPSAAPIDPALIARAAVLVVALSWQGPDCARKMKEALSVHSSAPVVFVGPKHFGANVNPFGRVPMERRASVFSIAPQPTVVLNEALRSEIPRERYIDQMRALGPDGRRVRFFDGRGNPLTADRIHLTLYGARFVARALQRSGSPALRAVAQAQPPAR